MFECLAFFPPSEKRSKQSEQPRDLMQISKEERTKPPPLRSEGSEKIKKNQHDSISVEYRKLLSQPLRKKRLLGKFANLGNTCYMNAMLQGLFAMDFFAKDLFKFCKKVQNRNVDLGEVIPMSSALSSLASIRDRASYHQKRELLRAIKDVSCFKGSAQQDANEFLVHVLNQVHDECDKLLHEQYGITDAGVRRMRNPVMANFAFTTQSTIVCDMCHHVSQIDEDSIILPVTINVLEQASERFSKKFLRFPSVQTLLDEYLKTENVERKCEVCGENIGQRTQKFVKLPRCLIIFIKRYAYDVSGSVKRDDKIDIPLYLTLNGHCTELSAPFLAVPTSTKKINFATASPIKLKLSTILSGTPSPARRRLDLSDKEINYDTRKVNDIEETHPAMTSLCNRPMDYKADGTNTAANHHMDFVVPGIGSNLKGGDQIAENFDVPRNSTEKKSQSSNSLTCEELSQLSDEEQLRTLEESHMRSLAQSPIAGKVQEKQGKDEEIVIENFDMPCSMQREIKTSTPDVQKGSMIEHYQEKMSLESPSSVDGREILEESGMQLVPYKPMSAEKRRAICSQIGLRFNHDCIEKTTVRIMNPNDRPSRVADVVGDGNCLFRALAFYFAGSDIEHSRVRECIVEFEAEHWNEFAALKGWSSEIWNDHMNQLLTDNTWGTEIELFAVAAMLNVDVWTYYEKRWICYRPRFKIQNGDVIPISVGDYRLGDNDGVYLLNEFNHFTPVLEPSNALLLREGADERICDLIINANEGFLKPSYRLVSIISHLGDTSESGHYVCDIWCKKNKGWLLCDDESISPISETKIRTRNNVGYIYFYLNR
uniref:Ubiquitinyl hydrolase 1 n=1 Tax=Onchocerca volvulus TaxID=6282 RepID=A0A8R1Y328_ONCVO